MKAVKLIVLVVVLAIIGVVVYVALNAGSLAKRAIESVGPTYLGTSVSIDDIQLSLSDKTAAVKGLTIGNPPGFEGPYSMQLDSIEVTLDPANVSSELIELKQVTIDGARVAAIAKGLKDTNFAAILDHVERTVGAPQTAESDNSKEVKVIIDRLDFVNASASVSSDVFGNEEISIPDIHLQGIGRKSDGVTMGEVAEQLLKPINAAIAKELIRRQLGTDDLKQDLEDKLRSKLSDKLKGLGRFGHPDS